jgi:PKD repeat protein
MFVSEIERMHIHLKEDIMKTTLRSACLMAAVFILAGFKTGSAQSACSVHFTWTQTAPNVISFASTSTGAYTPTWDTDTGTYYSWNFGDGESDYLTSPNHTFDIPGKYLVCLTMTNSIDTSIKCTSIFCDSVLVTGSVICTWPSTNGLIGVQNASCSTCSDGSASIIIFGSHGPGPFTYSWSGNGISGSSSQISGLHAGDTYTVSITDGYCSAVYTTMVLSNDSNCHAQYTKMQTAPNSVQFTSTSLHTSSNTAYYWDFSDGFVDYSANPTHVFDIPGIYTVCLYISDSSGYWGNGQQGNSGGFCHSTFCDTVKVTGSVICNLQAGTSVIYSTCSTCADGSVLLYGYGGTLPYTYSWPSAPSLPPTADTLSGLSPGTYTGCVIDANGCQACASTVLTFQCSMWTMVTDTIPSCGTCNNGSATVHVFGGQAPYTYSWSSLFGGGTALPSTASLSGLPQGPYQVCVTDASGCQSCINAILIPSNNCNASFTLHADSANAGDYIATNTSFGRGTLSYLWNWGDGTIDSSSATPSHTYSAPGMYTICISIRDSGGCSSQYCDTLSALRLPSWLASHHTRVNVVNPATVLGIQETKLLDSWKVYPNPSQGAVTIRYTLLQNSGINLAVYDEVGREVLALENIASQVSGSHEVHFNASDLQAGSYFVRMKTNDKVETQRIILMK